MKSTAIRVLALVLAFSGAAGAQTSVPANVGDNANIIPIYASDPPDPNDYLRGNLLGQRCRRRWTP